MLKNRRCKNEGITLIALVVTIILILILTGVSISTLTGQNGLLNRAVDAKKSTEIAQIEEMVKIVTMDALAQGNGTITSSNLKNSLDSNLGSGKYELSEKNGVYTVIIGERSIDINADGQVSKSLPVSANGLDANTPIKNPSTYGNNAQATADGAGKYFALPDGAKYVTGTVDTGVVVDIKESEFVWVPVDDVVLDTSREVELPKSKEDGTSKGKTYTPMAVKVGNDYKGVLYDFSGSNGYLIYSSNANYQGGSNDFREPDVVISYDGGDYDTVDGKVTISELTSEYNAMIESVLKYKGFYVARYEAGLDVNKNIVFKDAHIIENNVTTADASNTETKTWYGLYKKIKTFTTDSDKVVSSMIWGSQYDAMINWMAKNGKTVGIPDILKVNTGTVTGEKKEDVINNVYDLYGCHQEWTLEANSTYGRNARGGELSYNSPTTRYIVNSYKNSETYSSRSTIYVK